MMHPAIREALRAGWLYVTDRILGVGIYARGQR